MATEIDRDGIREAYADVRDDNTETNWVVFKYEGKVIKLESSGTNYDEFKSKFTDDDRAYGFIRVTTGDELSKRVKFALITWVGSSVSALKRGKVSTDKSLVKTIIKNFAVEIATNEFDDLEEDAVKERLQKAGGANYGTGSRD